MEENIQNQTHETPRGVKIASTLSWFWGILLLFSTAAIGIAIASEGGPFIFPLLLGVFGVLFCITGYGLRKLSKYARWLAILCSVAISTLLILIHFPISPIGVLICVVIAILVGLNWNKFKK